MRTWWRGLAGWQQELLGIAASAWAVALVCAWAWLLAELLGYPR